MRRAAVSVPSNIAEGKGHHSEKEFSHFLFHARGSLLIAEELQYLSRKDGQRLSAMCEGVSRALGWLDQLALLQSYLIPNGEPRTTNG